MKQMELLSKLSDKTERFNENLIRYRSSESTINNIIDICKAFEVIEYIKFDGLEIIENENEIPIWKRVNIDQSRVRLVKLKFTINFGKETKIVEKEIFVPKLIDNCFYLVNGVRYYPTAQLIDRGVFVTAKSYSIKTMLMPIRFNWKRVNLKDENNHLFSVFDFKLNLFKQSINPLYYFIAKMGLIETIEYFGYNENDIAIVEATKDDIKEDNNHYWFLINKNLYLMVTKNKFNHQFDFDFIQLLLVFLKENHKELIKDEYNWKKVLGINFTKSINSIEDKANKVLFSLERILDDSTKKQFSEIEDEYKKDTYSILKWMLQNFDNHRKIDYNDLDNKRLRVWPIAYPLLMLFSKATYRILNTRNLTIKTIAGVFNIRPNFLLKNMITSNSNIRYSNYVNVIDLFGAYLKVVCKPGGNTTDVSEKARGIHPSYIGKLSLISSSASDPGITSTIVPFSEIDESGRFK